MRAKVIITDCDHGHLDPERAVASERGVEVVAAEGDLEAVAEHLAEADALLTQYVRVGDELLARAPGVRVVGRYGVGIDTIDLEATDRRGIEVVNVPDFCFEELADHAITLALVGLRRVALLDRAWRSDPGGFAERWEERFALLAGVERSSRQRFGIIGFGRSGRAVARRAAGFGFDVLAHDPLLDDVEVSAAGATPAGLDELLASADVVTLHLPATPETEGLIAAESLARMKQGAVLVNTARGSLVDERALVEAVREGRLAAACLDVTADEPPDPDDPLLAEERILLTPHVGFFSETSIDELKHRAMRRVVDALRPADGGG